MRRGPGVSLGIMALNKVDSVANKPPKTVKPVRHRTASGNAFTAVVTGGFDPKTRGINLAAPKPGYEYKMYTIEVTYEDKKGLFKGADSITTNANSREVKRNFGKGVKDDRNLQQSTGAALKRTGPNTFQGTVTVVLEGKKGVSREDVSSVGFTFAKLENNSYVNAKFDGAKYQEYRVPMKLIGPR